MFKPTKLLKVVSIIIIVFAVIGAISVGLSYVGLQSLKQMEGIDPSLIEASMAAFTPLNIALSAIGIIIQLACGILGVSGKAYKAAFTLMIISIVLDIVGVFTAGTAITGFVIATMAIGFILPVLYLWGLYQSKE